MIKSNKIISFLFIVLCIVIFFYVWIFLCTKYANTGYCGADGNKHNVKWNIDEFGTLTISGTGEMASYGEFEKETGNFIFGNPKWNKYRKEKIKRVVIEDGITSIGNQAFYGCTSLEEVVIPDSVTDIGSTAFCRCESLKKVNIPESVTVIPEGMFNGCRNLEEIVIPDSVQTIEMWAFIGCEKLRNITVPENLTDFGRYAFQNTGLASEENGLLIINNVLVDGIKCTGDVVIPDGVTKIGAGAFRPFNLTQNENIVSVTLPDSVETIDEFAFDDCVNLERINIPENLKNINTFALSGCKNLTGELILPESVENVGEYAFSGAGLDTITVLNPELDLPDYDYAYYTSHWTVNRVTE